MMPVPRQYQDNASRQRAYRARVKEQRAADLLPGDPDSQAPAALYRRWDKHLSQAAGVLAGLVEEMRAYQEERSERWQESERGEAFADRLTEIEELTDRLQELLT